MTPFRDYLFEGYRKYKIRSDGRIVSLVDFDDVKVGDVGGFVGDEYNLSTGKNKSWIYDDAECKGNDARVFQHGKMYGKSKNLGGIVQGNGIIKDSAVLEKGYIQGKAVVSGKAIISGSSVEGNAKIYGNAKIHGWSDSVSATGKAEIYGDANLRNSKVSKNAKVYGNARLEDSEVTNKAQVYGKAMVDDCKISKNAKVFGNSYLRDEEIDFDVASRKAFDAIRKAEAKADKAEDKAQAKADKDADMAQAKADKAQAKADKAKAIKNAKSFAADSIATKKTKFDFPGISAINAWNKFKKGKKVGDLLWDYLGTSWTGTGDNGVYGDEMTDKNVQVYKLSNGSYKFVVAANYTEYEYYDDYKIGGSRHKTTEIDVLFIYKDKKWKSYTAMSYNGE
jgi:hypothetical protein